MCWTRGDPLGPGPLVAWTAGLDLCDMERAPNCLALRHEDEYPMNEGRLRASSGTEFGREAFERHIEEHQVAHSTALHASRTSLRAKSG